jgi:hypothetical protein
MLKTLYLTDRELKCLEEILENSYNYDPNFYSLCLKVSTLLEVIREGQEQIKIYEAD